jgi:hypothetical protein
MEYDIAGRRGKHTTKGIVSINKEMVGARKDSRAGRLSHK